MKKSDLKDGMIVELRNKDKCIVVGDRLLDKLSYVDFVSYNDDLICSKKELDVIRVYENDCMCSLSDRYNNEKLKLLWERKEIDWAKVPPGIKVKCWDNYYTENIYEGIFLEYDKNSFDVSPYKVYVDESDEIWWDNCELIEGLKEELTLEILRQEYLKYCKTYIVNNNCVDCKYIDNRHGCFSSFILQNYNVTRKE